MKYGIGKFIDQKPVNYYTLDFTRIVAYCNRLERLERAPGGGGYRVSRLKLKNELLGKQFSQDNESYQSA